MMWILKSVMKKKAGSYQTKLAKWKTEISSSATMNELLNNFYDALKELFNIELRGERKQNLKRKYGDSIEDVLEFIKEIEHSSYGAQDDADLSDFKLKALAFLNFRGHKK
jgi:DNA repair ATPase RecN